MYQVALCRHGLTRPQVADGGDSLQVLRIAADILSNQYRMANKGRSSGWWGGGGVRRLAETTVKE